VATQEVYSGFRYDTYRFLLYIHLICSEVILQHLMSQEVHVLSKLHCSCTSTIHHITNHISTAYPPHPCSFRRILFLRNSVGVSIGGADIGHLMAFREAEFYPNFGA